MAAWIHVDAAGRITGYTGKTEIGQNIRTSLAQAIADELRVPMPTVALIMADTDLVPFDPGTFGSLSTPRMAPVLARAAVTAREMLIDRAAALWSVDRAHADLQGRRGSPAAAASIGFGDLVKDRKLAGIVPAERARLAARPRGQFAARPPRRSTAAASSPASIATRRTSRGRG